MKFEEAPPNPGSVSGSFRQPTFRLNDFSEGDEKFGKIDRLNTMADVETVFTAPKKEGPGRVAGELDGVRSRFPGFPVAGEPESGGLLTPAHGFPHQLQLGKDHLLILLGYPGEQPFHFTEYRFQAGNQG